MTRESGLHSPVRRRRKKNIFLMNALIVILFLFICLALSVFSLNTQQGSFDCKYYL